MKFVQSETSLGEGSKIVHYKCGDFEISASRHAVVLKGDIPIETSDHLDILAHYIARAWQHHGKMKHNDKKME